MPVIRCSNEVYRLLQDRALQDDEPVSIVLDRIVFLELKKPKPQLDQLPKPRRKRKTKPKPNPLPEPVRTVVETVAPKAKRKPKKPTSDVVFSGSNGGYECGACHHVFRAWKDARAHALSEHPVKAGDKAPGSTATIPKKKGVKAG